MTDWKSVVLVSLALLGVISCNRSEPQPPLKPTVGPKPRSPIETCGECELSPAPMSDRFLAGSPTDIELRNGQSRNNLRRIGIALLRYYSRHKEMPGQAIRNEQGEMLLSWRVAILPILNHKVLYDRFKLDESWDSPHNVGLLDEMPSVYQNPHCKPGSTTNYLAPICDGCLFSPDPEKSPQLTGRSRESILLVEANIDREVPWTSPQDLPVTPAIIRNSLGNFHTGQCTAVLATGQVRTFTSDDYPEIEKLLQLTPEH